jgi:tetrahydromethanopterin S-methyltransferase subunit B
MTRTISNSDDVIDSRDVIERIAELESERQDLTDALTTAQTEYFDTLESRTDDAKQTLDDAQQALDEWDEENGAELKALQALADEASGSPDWKYGETLIRDSYFEEYAQELAEDIGAIKTDASWPNNHIDWEAAADALKQDYMSVEFDGVEYWIRA